VGPSQHNCRRIVFLMNGDDYIPATHNTVVSFITSRILEFLSTHHRSPGHWQPHLLRVAPPKLQQEICPLLSHNHTRHTQTIAKLPADPEETPSETTPAPTQEHPVSHPYLPTQKRQPISNVSRCLIPYYKLYV